MNCDTVPQHWRRRIAVSVYLGTRAGELDALQWEDFHIDQGIVHIHRAVDRSQDDATKGTKSNQARRFRIEPELMPLLVAMKLEAGGQGLLFPSVNATEYSKRLQIFLRRAGVDRGDLTTSDQTRRRLSWHDLRATAATWLAVQGVEPLKIMQRLGHRNFSTTMIYVREAEQLRDGFGDVFPELPNRLLQKLKSPAILSGPGKTTGNAAFSVTPRGFEPLLPA